MGVSTDAIICYGIHLPDEGSSEVYEKFEGVISKLFAKQKDKFEYRFKFEATFPIQMVQHCSYEYPMYILAIRTTHVVASRGYPREFNPADLVVSEADISLLKAFCEEHGFDYKEPKWYLASMWG